MELEQLKSLRDRVAQATGPDREIDAAIAVVFDMLPPDSDPRGRMEQSATHYGHGWVGYQKLGTERVVSNSYYTITSSRYTSSIDAALAWVERLLPGWEDFTGFNPEHYFDGKQGCAYCVLSFDDKRYSAVARTRPLAVILTGLDALIAQAKEGGS